MGSYRGDEADGRWEPADEAVDERALTVCALWGGLEGCRGFYNLVVEAGADSKLCLS